MDVAVKWKKTKAVELVKWLVKKGVDKIVEEHKLMIEEKYTQLALVSDDLQAREYANVGLQDEIRAKDHEIERGQNQIVDLIANRHVPRRGEFDTNLKVLEKITKELGKPGRYEYYMIRCQKRQLSARINVLRMKYPDMHMVKGPSCEDGNSVHCWNRF